MNQNYNYAEKYTCMLSGLFYPFRNGSKLNLQQYYEFSEQYLQTPFSYFGLSYGSVYVSTLIHATAFLKSNLTHTSY